MSITKHQAKSLSLALEHRLSAYAKAASAAGVGMLALAQPAPAKIVFTPVHQKLPINQDFYIDLNHNGTNEFGFRAVQKHVDHGSDTTSTYGSLIVYPAEGNGVIGKPFASALSAGALIGPKAQFNSAARIGMGGVRTQSHNVSYWGQWDNGGRGVQGRYLGVKFLIKGKVHFGWARFNLRIRAGQDDYLKVHAVLTGYAYETVVNKPIMAGKTKGPDLVTVQEDTVQSGSLGRLALGRK